MQRFGPAVLTTLIAALALTWVMRRLALALGILDQPDSIRKFHLAPVPLLGGVAVFCAWTIGLISFLDPWPVTPPGRPGDFLGTLLLAALVAVITGVLDDCLSLRARWKLLGQALSAALVVGGSLAVRRLEFCGYTVELRWGGVIFTLVWLIGSMNAINMLDGLDGLAASIGLLICLAVAGMAGWQHDSLSALISLTLAASLAGFLIFNLPPARIFLGDSGSTVIGLVLGALALRIAWRASGSVTLAPPVLLLTVPIFDGTAAVIRRCLCGMAIYAPDSGHIHHRLQQRGWSQVQVLAGLAGLSAFTSLSALACVTGQRESFAAMVSLAVIVGCVATGLFGREEYLLLREWAGQWKVSRRRARLSAMVHALPTCTSVAPDELPQFRTRMSA